MTAPKPLRCLCLGALVLVAAGLAGCSPKEITPLERKQGASYASEAAFAANLRDFARAEGLLAQAVAVCPDTTEYWISLGTARRKLDNRSGARDAFKSALKAARAVQRRLPDNSQAVIQEVYLLALLGKDDDARSTLEKARRDHPDDRTIRLFLENKELDRLLADPGFKDLKP
ncbi:MAG: hypothetical protein JSR48_10725 [Verrucomicrobia bacterium]|nr:hypothetical protein [Verrucomicrobiota bacterium]